MDVDERAKLAELDGKVNLVGAEVGHVKDTVGRTDRRVDDLWNAVDGLRETMMKRPQWLTTLLLAILSALFAGLLGFVLAGLPH